MKVPYARPDLKAFVRACGLISDAEGYFEDGVEWRRTRIQLLRLGNIRRFENGQGKRPGEPGHCKLLRYYALQQAALCFLLWERSSKMVAGSRRGHGLD